MLSMTIHGDDDDDDISNMEINKDDDQSRWRLAVPHEVGHAIDTQCSQTTYGTQRAWSVCVALHGAGLQEALLEGARIQSPLAWERSLGCKGVQVCDAIYGSVFDMKTI